MFFQLISLFTTFNLDAYFIVKVIKENSISERYFCSKRALSHKEKVSKMIEQD